MTVSHQLDAAADLRRQWKANDDRRDKGLAIDQPGVRRFADITYGPAGSPWNLLDVSVPERYLADGADGGTSAPVIISIHGGGWFHGTKQTYQFWAAHMASPASPPSTSPIVCRRTASSPASWTTSPAPSHGWTPTPMTITLTGATCSSSATARAARCCCSI